MGSARTLDDLHIFRSSLYECFEVALDSGLRSEVTERSKGEIYMGR